MGSQSNQVEYMQDFHLDSLGLTTAQGNLPQKINKPSSVPVYRKADFKNYLM